MGQGSLIRKLSRRTVPLENLTRLAVEAGELPEGQQLTIQIRRVTALEVTKATGGVPSLLRVARMRQPGESDEQWRERWQQMIAEQPELVTESIEYAQRLKVAVLCAGCVAPRVVPSDADLAAGDDDALTVADLADDADAVYEAIIEFSGLPFRLRQGGGAVSTFPEQPSGGGGEPHGALLREDAERAAEPPAGGVEPGLGDLAG